MLQTTFGLNKEYLKYIDKEKSEEKKEDNTYTIFFIDGATETFKKVGIKKNIINYIDLHIEILENVLNQAERLQTINKKITDEENKENTQNALNQAERLQAENNAIAIFNDVPVERLKKIFTLENISILEKLIANEKSGVLVDHSTIPDHYRKLSNNKSVSIRMNEEIYNKMKLHSLEIGESIATITNFIFDMYLKEFKK